MSRIHYRQVVRDAQGDATVGALITVRNAAGSLSTIYDASSGGAALGNGTTFVTGDGDPEKVGAFEFWIDDTDQGIHEITVGSGPSADTFPIPLFPSLADYGIGLDAGPLVTDLDAQFTWGSYMAYGGSHASAASGDSPFPTVNGAFALEVGNGILGGTNEYAWQRATLFTAGEVIIKIRSIGASGAGWSDWQFVSDTSRDERVVGRDGIPATGVASGASSPFVFHEPVAFNGVVSSIKVFCMATGSLPIKVFRQRGDDFVQVGTDYTITVTATGLQTFTPADFGTISVAPGDFLGYFNDGSVVALKGVSGHDEYFAYSTAAPGNVSTLTPNTVLNSSQLQIGFTVTPDAPQAMGRGGIVASGAAFSVEKGASQKIIAHMAYGQSWMASNGLNGSFTAFQSALYPLRLVTLNDGTGPLGWQGVARTASRGLWPLQEITNNVQTPIGAMGNRLARNMDLLGRSGAVFARSEAHGSQSLANLMPSDDVDYAGTSQAYANLIAAVTELVTHATAMEMTAEVATVTWCHGASDTGTAYATYKTRFSRLIDEIQTDVQAATGQTSGPTILIVQAPGGATSGNWPNLQAQVDLAGERSDVVLAGTGWAIPQHDTIHFDDEGTVQVGEIAAMAAEAVVLGQYWSAPFLRNVTRSGTTITAEVGGPHAIMIDETIATDRHQVSSSYVDDYGFEYSGANITAVAVEPRKITITIDADAGGTLGYAYHGSSRGDSKSVNRGTLRAEWKAKSAFVDRDLSLWLASGYWTL